jgi:hypothetical protein
MRKLILALLVGAVTAARPLRERVAFDLKRAYEAGDFISEKILGAVEYDVGYLDYQAGRGSPRPEIVNYIEAVLEHVENYIQ